MNTIPGGGWMATGTDAQPDDTRPPIYTTVPVVAWVQDSEEPEILRPVCTSIDGYTDYPHNHFGSQDYVIWHPDNGPFLPAEADEAESILDQQRARRARLRQADR